MNYFRVSEGSSYRFPCCTLRADHASACLLRTPQPREVCSVVAPDDPASWLEEAYREGTPL